jgi:hypothetical protein
MAIISIIEGTGSKVGITATVTNSEQKIETQLNRLKDEADDPMALISWDMTTTLVFDDNGFLKNPTTPITMLLMSKADSAEKVDREKKAEEMGDLFIKFIQQLRENLVKYNRSFTSSTLVTGAQYQLVPKYGMGKHSGIIANFTMIGPLDNC